MINLPRHDEESSLIEELDTALKGAIIVGITQPTKPEHLFILAVKYPNGDIQEIEIGATELGWWLSKPFTGKHNFQKMGLLRGGEADFCYNCHKFSDDEEINPDVCKGYYG